MWSVYKVPNVILSFIGSDLVGVSNADKMGFQSDNTKLPRVFCNCFQSEKGVIVREFCPCHCKGKLSFPVKHNKVLDILGKINAQRHSPRRTMACIFRLMVEEGAISVKAANRIALEFRRNSKPLSPSTDDDCSII